MRKATNSERERSKRDWKFGGELHTKQVIQCDHCPDSAIAFRADGETANWFCADGFRAHMAEQRATRPSRDELIRRVNASIGT